MERSYQTGTGSKCLCKFIVTLSHMTETKIIILVANVDCPAFIIKSVIVWSIGKYCWGILSSGLQTKVSSDGSKCLCKFIVTLSHMTDPLRSNQNNNSRCQSRLSFFHHQKHYSLIYSEILLRDSFVRSANQSFQWRYCLKNVAILKADIERFPKLAWNVHDVNWEWKFKTT